MAAKKKAAKTGPKPETLHIEGNWKDAVSHALGRGKPPDSPKKKERKKAI